METGFSCLKEGCGKSCCGKLKRNHAGLISVFGKQFEAITLSEEMYLL